jgi:hypothetical protein
MVPAGEASLVSWVGRGSPRPRAASLVARCLSGRRGTIAPVWKLIKIALVVLGIRAFLRWRKSRRQQHEAATPSAPSASDPADELRRKLAESRVDDGGEVAPAPPEATVADRRAEVHDQGRAAVDEMKSSDEA